RVEVDLAHAIDEIAQLLGALVFGLAGERPQVMVVDLRPQLEAVALRRRLLEVLLGRLQIVTLDLEPRDLFGVPVELAADALELALGLAELPAPLVVRGALERELLGGSRALFGEAQELFPGGRDLGAQLGGARLAGADVLLEPDAPRTLLVAVGGEAEELLFERALLLLRGAHFDAQPGDRLLRFFELVVERDVLVPERRHRIFERDEPRPRLGERGHRRLGLARRLVPLRLEVELLVAELVEPRDQARQLLAIARQILLQRQRLHLAGVRLFAHPLERRLQLIELGAQLLVPVLRVVVLRLEVGDDPVELADLALLRQDARARRLPRPAGDDAGLVDQLAVDGDVGALVAAAPTIERRQEILDDEHVAEQRLGHRAVVLAERDHVEEAPAHAVARLERRRVAG